MRSLNRTRPAHARPRTPRSPRRLARLSRRHRSERGAIAVVVSLLTISLLGFGSLVIDVGALYQERRELQNGADSSALAVAKDCALDDCGTFGATASSYADANADDGQATVEEVCGNGSGLPACSDPATVPTGASGYVQVRTRTLGAGGAQVPFSLARIFGMTGKTVHAKAVAAWGGVGRANTLPLTFGLCEYNQAVARAGGIQSGPPFTGDAQYVYFHNTVDAQAPCPADPAGTDVPGGFGKLAADDRKVPCDVPITVGGWAQTETGNNFKSIDECMAPYQNKFALIPIFDQVTGTGDGSQYHIIGFASVYITGYMWNGTSKWPSDFSCPSASGTSSVCIRGYFGKVVTNVGSGEFGPDLGTRMVRMIG